MRKEITEIEKEAIANIFTKALTQNFILITANDNGLIDMAYNSSNIITGLGLLASAQYKLASDQLNFNEMENGEDNV